MRSKEDVLQEINADLPNLDWRGGARRYLAGYFERYGVPAVEEFTKAKPLSPITPEDPAGGLAEVVGYLHNFANAVQLLQLPRRARILDVACGGGWVSHWLTKLGYRTHGIDISADFVALAARRIGQDSNLTFYEEDARPTFEVHDIEAGPLDPAVAGFDAAILESCLHHFIDPIAALTHIADALGEAGVVLIIEGENRAGAIRAEYMQVMIETETLERPYPRALLLEVLDQAGLAHREFLGALNGYIPESSPLFGVATQHLKNVADGSNVCICARSIEALRRVVPTYAAPAEASTLEVVPPAPEAAVVIGPPAARRFGRVRRILGRLARGL